LKIKIILMSLLSLVITTPLFAHGISDADKQSMIDGGYLQYIELGASHMLTGYDHLLFLFGVMFFLTKFQEIVKFITAFTAGHCITLIAATYMKISINYFLIDAIIALTVFYKGFDNIGGFKKFLNMKSPNLLRLVFVFGLIHGMGLSTRLQQLPLGEDGLLLRILSFNVGVEIGQILALTVMLLILISWRKTASFKQFSTASNVGLMAAGVLLFFMQMHGIAHDSFVDDLAFSKDSHSHAHSTMVKATVNDVSNSDPNSGKVPDKDQWKDSITLSIPGGKSIEYKFHVKKGDLLEYSWETNSGKLFFDFHGEPQGDTTGKFESFKKSTESESSGSFTAPFEGSHGWYWKNKGIETVKVTLKTKGSYKIIGVR
jgi:hypothetical protein